MFTRERLVGAAAIALLLGVAGVAVAVAPADDWNPLLLGVLLVLVLGADLLDIEFKQLSIAGNFLGLVVAMAILGPAPAALLGVLSNVAWILRTHPRVALGLATTASFACAFMAGGLVTRAVADATGRPRTTSGSSPRSSRASRSPTR